MGPRPTDAPGGLELVPLEPGERADARALLASNGLPAADLDDPDVALFAAVEDGRTVGVGGLEQYGTAALLRSVAVRADRRGEGHGTRLCRALAVEARDRGVETLYLLTTDAAGFFEGLGFERCDRESAPTEVRGSDQFTDLCPSSAVCMTTDL